MVGVWRLLAACELLLASTGQRAAALLAAPQSLWLVCLLMLNRVLFGVCVSVDAIYKFMHKYEEVYHETSTRLVWKL